MFPTNALYNDLRSSGGGRDDSSEPGGDAARAELSGAGLFKDLWESLADVLGTAATATLLRRAARRAVPRSPELAELAIAKANLEYRYTLPSVGTAQLSGYGISFAADNVIQLKYVEVEGRLERGISVLKARGVCHATDVRRLRFSPTGLEVGSPFEGLRGVRTGLPVPSGGKEKEP